MGAGEEKAFTLAQVSEHTSTEDCWLIINGKVYDVSKFLDEHPGGNGVLLSVAGKDATTDFEDIGHSPSAKEMTGKYYVGKMDSSAAPVKEACMPSKQPHHNPNKTKESIVKIIQYLAPFLVLGLVLGIRFCIKSIQTI